MKIKEVYCKSALSPSALSGIDYSLNPYRGCVHSCAYCYVPSVLHLNREEWGKWVEARINIPNVLHKELKRKKKGVVGVSTVTDPYQEIEKEYKLTRYCLEQLLRKDFPISIQTKSDLVLRDIDLISEFSSAEVGITLTTLKERERSLLEPKAPSIEKRLRALEKLSENNIDTYAFLGPLYPTVENEDAEEMIKTLADIGVKRIIVDDLHLKEGVWDSIKSALSKEEHILLTFEERLFRDRSYYSSMFRKIKGLSKLYGLKFERESLYF